jgi:hypothetical protein
MATAINWTKFGAVLFDLDGVVTPTAEVHERAWAELFADRGTSRGDDYLTYVDGKPRYDGVRSFLTARAASSCPWGTRRPARRRHDLRDGQPQERHVQRRARPRRHRPVPRHDRRARPARPARRAPGDRVVVEERPPVLDAAGLGDGSSTWSTASPPPRRALPASRRPTCSSAPPNCSGSTRPTRWWSRTPRPAWPPVPPAGSARARRRPRRQPLALLDAGADLVVDDLARPSRAREPRRTVHEEPR